VKTPTAGGAELREIVDRLFQNMQKVEIELFTLMGTGNVFMDRIAGEEKLATKVLRHLATSQSLKGLQRLNVSSCWIDFDTIAAVKDVLLQSSISALRLKNLKFGFQPRTVLEDPVQVVMKMRNANCNDVQNRCLQCSCSFPCLFCFFPCCCFCNKLPDYPETKKCLDSQIDEFEYEYEKIIKGRVDEQRVEEGFQDLKSAFMGMRDRATGGIDIMDFSGTSLPQLCGTAKRVNLLLNVIAQQQPTAINFNKSGLSDVHVSGICDMFFHNQLLTHFDISVCSSSTEGLENLQSLAQIAR